MASKTSLLMDNGTKGLGSPFEMSTMSSLSPTSILRKFKPERASLEILWKSASRGCSAAILDRSMLMFCIAATTHSASCCLCSLSGLLMFEIGVEVGAEVFDVRSSTSSEKCTLFGAAEVESGDAALKGRLEFVDSGVSPPGVEVALRGSSLEVSGDVAPAGVEPMFVGRMLLISINWTNKCGV